MINAKKYRKTREWERPETSSRKSDTKGPFHEKLDTVNYRNGMDLTEAEDSKKRWEEYTELYKKYHHDLNKHDGDHSLKARYPGMRSQVGLRKHHYEQS